MTAFIAEHREIYGVEPICKVLPITPSTYYAQAARQADPELRPNRACRDDALCGEILRVWDENKQVYGVRKVWRQLLREGIGVARCTVARLMKRLRRWPAWCEAKWSRPRTATRPPPVRTTK